MPRLLSFTFCQKISVEVAAAGIASNSATIQENRDRLTNTDSSLGNMCQLLDRVYYSTQSPQRKCCYEDHDDTTGRTGNFMYCLPTTQADVLFGTDPGEGTCSTYSNGSKKGCGGLAPAKRKKKK